MSQSGEFEEVEINKEHLELLAAFWKGDRKRFLEKLHKNPHLLEKIRDLVQLVPPELLAGKVSNIVTGNNISIEKLLEEMNLLTIFLGDEVQGQGCLTCSIAEEVSKA